MKKDDVVLYSEESAAKQVTVTGWVSRTGQFWGNDEHMARWCGCTHTACKECSAPVEKSYVKCKACRQKAEIAKYEAMERREWNGSDMLYSDAHDRYFQDIDDLTDFLHDEPFTVEDLRLIICEPNKPRLIDPYDHMCDQMPEDDGDIPDDVLAAFEALNAVLAKAGPLSWSPGEFAAIVNMAKEESAAAAESAPPETAK